MTNTSHTKHKLLRTFADIVVTPLAIGALAFLYWTAFSTSVDWGPAGPQSTLIYLLKRESFAAQTVAEDSIPHWPLNEPPVVLHWALIGLWFVSVLVLLQSLRISRCLLCFSTRGRLVLLIGALVLSYLMEGIPLLSDRIPLAREGFASITVALSLFGSVGLFAVSVKSVGRTTQTD